MNTSYKNQTQLRFSNPDPLTNMITVQRVNDKHETQTIGQIYAEFTEESGSVLYTSISKSGEELIPPTSDFIEVEKRFYKYTKELENNLYLTNLEELENEYSKREEALNSLRNSKGLLKLKLLNR